MEFKRDIYKNLVKWKQADTGKVLQVSGARQVGKTYILRKFAEENFKHVIYINMAEPSGEEFLQCMDKVREWEPGTPREEKPVHKALELFDSGFKDTKDTIIVIDEIQESHRVFNLVRPFAREFDCYVIVTGSYLGRLLAKEFFLPAGDFEDLTLETLTFVEFTEVFGKRDLYDSVGLFGGSDSAEYNELKEIFDLYQRIGGYPSVVNIYLEHKNFELCDVELRRLMEIFTNESKRYFDDVMETNAFEKLFHGIAITLIKEKQGIRDLVEDLSKIVYKEESGRFTKKMINHAIGWLQASHIIAYASKSIDCDYLNIKENARFYFLDIGIAHYFIARAGADEATISGILAENFVYLSLLRHISKDIAGNAPWFAWYEKSKGELDFYVRSLIDYKNYGLEVKAGSNSGNTAIRLLLDRKIDYIFYLKGDTFGGVAGKTLTLPIYLADRMSFDLGEGV
jgi:predicted AAA+ superfamily ATPase